MLKYIQNQKGFNLLEVTIAAGLLAVLASLSIPPYKKYIRRSKTTEAKISLSQIYQAEKTFFMQWRFYTQDLALIGVVPEGELLYNVGFESTTSSPLPHYQGPPPKTDQSFMSFYGLCGAKIGEGPSEACGFTEAAEPPNIPKKCGKNIDCAVSNTKFTAAAIADLRNKIPKNPGSVEGKDIWTINQYRQVIHFKNGTN